MSAISLNAAKYLAAISVALALTATTAALAVSLSSSASTLTIPAPFGSSPVLAWSWGASNSGTTHLGGGIGAGKANIQDLTITRIADGQSPLFFSYVAKGLFLPRVVLVDGATTITLTEVLVTSYSTGNSSDAKSPTRTENITFNFSQVTYTVNGAATCFNIATNTSC